MSRRMCARCAGCPAYQDGAFCLFCEDGVPCDCRRKLNPIPPATKPLIPKKRKRNPVKRMLALAGIEPPPVKLQGFAAHLDRRMREHREWQEETTAQLVHDFMNIAWVVFREMDARHSRTGSEKFQLEGNQL